MQPQRRFRASLLACLPLILAGSSSADVLGVSPLGEGGGNYTTIQAAVDAAQDGDTIWVGTGDYPGFTIDGKSLKLIVSPGAQVLVVDTLNVINLPVGGTLVIDGLEVRSPFGAALYATSNLGHVRFEDCEFFGGITEDAARLDTNPSIAFTRCTFMGGYGREYPSHSAHSAGNGVTSMTSAVMFYDCTVQGGDGATIYSSASFSHGGDGCSAPDWGVIASNTIFSGGNGGDNRDFVPVGGGNGGDGLVIGVNARAEMLDNVTQGGAAGEDVFGGPVAAPGVGISGGGPIHVYPETARVFEAQASLVPAGRSLEVSVQGQPGDSVYLPLSDHTTYIFKPSFFGIWLVPQRSIIPWSVWPTGTTIWPLPLGVIPPSGSLTVGVQMPDPPPGQSSHDVFLQGYILDPTGRPILGSPLHVFVPLCSAELPDCNDNGLFDGCDIVLGIAPDCDTSGILCDPDCNANSISDNCEIFQGAADCNGNNIPDDCEPDCNANSVPDDCDISGGTSLDSNSNGIPDDCEVAGQTWYVDASAPTGGDGSQLNPYQAIGDALAPSLPGDEILVADGTYVGPQNRGMLFGARDIEVRSINGSASCIIDLQGSGSAFSVPAGVTRAARIEGFTFRNGINWDSAVPSDQQRAGGAIQILDGSPTISNCVFENNASNRGGGAIGSDSGLPLIEDCFFKDNTDTAPIFNCGGGAFRGSAHIVRCTFTGNVASDGGAVHIISTSSTQSFVSHCSFIGNTGERIGGALDAVGGQPIISNCLFVANLAGYDGGALVVTSTTNAKLVNLTIVLNEAFGAPGTQWGGVGGGLFVRSGAHVALENSIVRQNSSPLGPQIGMIGSSSELTVAHTLTNNIYKPGLSTLFLGAIVMDADPSFVDLDGPDDDPQTLGDNDYHLGTNSPAVDSGDNAAVAMDILDHDGDANTTEPEPFDFDGSTRFADDPGVADIGSGTPPLVDMGCYER